MHGHWFISLREQDHAVLGRALHFIQITWFTYIFANIGRVPRWVQFAGCSLDLVTWASDGFFPEEAQEFFPTFFWGRARVVKFVFFPLETTKKRF